MDDVIEQCFRKTENKKLLRIFVINTITGIQKVTKEKKGKKSLVSYTS